jgi:hypothetical protein
MVARDSKFLAHLDEPFDYEMMRKKQNEVRRRRRVGENDDPYWSTPTVRGQYVWTDDYSNLLSVFRWPWSASRE